MTSVKPFEATDLFKLNVINLDPFTENFPIEFYLEYLILWPSLFFKTVETTSCTARDEISGYMMAKTEGKGPDWHAHITAVTVSPSFRRIALASMLCNVLETTTDFKPHEVNFIDLFVKCNNALAIRLYEKLGYSVYRRVVGYYNTAEEYRLHSLKVLREDKDAFDMRKAMSRDCGRSVRPNGRKHLCHPHEVRF
ncbi:AaceriADR038Cp [[Ashbya] aceris (nom. inval.)]|nr:AaceriADR038Cp [[Ashbya] aceris (nom. inval.)]